MRIWKRRMAGRLFFFSLIIEKISGIVKKREDERVSERGSLLYYNTSKKVMNLGDWLFLD